MTSENGILKFLSEIQMLKRVRHEGFKLTGINIPDSVAEHSLNAAQIAYVLGEMEGLDGSKCALINLFHDNAETRINDVHKVTTRYIKHKEASRIAEIELFENLPDKIKDKILPLLNEKREKSSREGIVAQDADWLEVAIQAKIYSEIGYKGCEKMIENVKNLLKTKKAKKLLSDIIQSKDFTNCWYEGLKNFDSYK